MKLTDETIKRIRHNKYSVDCIQGVCALSDGDIIGNLCDTVEALQQENEQLQAQVARMRKMLRKTQCNLPDDSLDAEIDDALSDAPTDYHNPADVEALKQAKEALENHECGIGYATLANGQVMPESCECCDDIREALAAIDKIGGREDA